MTTQQTDDFLRDYAAIKIASSIVAQLGVEETKSLDWVLLWRVAYKSADAMQQVRQE